jgi:hypothetical protein
MTASKRTAAADAAVLFCSITIVTSAQAIECPQSKMVRSGPARMSPTELKTLGKRLLDDRDGNVVEEFAARMRAKLPHVAAEDLSNALVSAYCEALKAQGETDPTATSKLRTFARATYERLAQQRTRKFKDATSIR